MANIGFISLGCAKNQVDCERMMYRVQEAGFQVQPDIVGADVVVINTCGFIDSAKTEAIDHILQTAQLKAQGLVGKILVTGCLSQRYQEEILKELPEVDGVLGTGSYDRIAEAIEALLEDHAVAQFDSIDAPEVETGRILTTPEHYAFIKIAEGCDNRCSYCIIPYLRGKFRSRQMDDVLYEARLLADNGVKELIVVAQDTSRYGTDFPEHKRLLPELLRELCKIDGIHWVQDTICLSLLFWKKKGIIQHISGLYSMVCCSYSICSQAYSFRNLSLPISMAMCSSYTNIPGIYTFSWHASSLVCIA